MVSAAPSTSALSVRIKSAVYRSDVGRERKTNEDGVLSLTKVPLWAVADGTGGAEPARVALTVLKDHAAQLQAKNADVARTPDTTSRLAVGRYLERLFARANAKVFEAAEVIRTRRIATTLCAATIVGEYAFVAHVGDSRAYLFRGGALRCLTNDHTIAAMQLRRGDITASEFATSPFRRTLSQAIGMSPALDVDVLALHLHPGDMLVVTSNGLNRALPDDVIAACLATEGDADARADLLVQKVNERGAPDNTTFILVEMEPAPRAKAPRDDLEAIVRRSFLYHRLSDPEWHQIQSYLELVDAKPGQTLCVVGQPAPGFAVLASGRLKTELAAGETTLVEPADHFGALALATDEASYETVTALEASQLFVLAKPRFQEILRLNPMLGGKLTLSLLESLGNSLGALTSRLGQILDAANGKP